MATNSKISTLVAGHIPDHIIEAYPDFVTFIEAYYEWLEESKQATDVLKTLLENQDVDTTSPGSVKITLSTGSGTYEQDEIVYQGLTIQNALAKGRVLFVGDGEIEITDVVGSFNTGFGPIVGLESDASYLISTIDFITASLNDFIRWFRVEFIPSIPKESITDIKKFIKHSRQFYKAKGTQKSYRLLFRILFNESIDFYYPWRDMFRADDAKWIQPRTVKVRANVGNPFELIGRRVRGVDSLASALVEDVVSTTIGPTTIYELFLNRLSISGTFIPEELIQLEDQSIIVRTSTIVEGIEITNTGEGYSVGDIIDFTSFSTGSGAQARITSVGDNGEIVNYEMINFGAEYDITNPPLVDFIPTSNTATGNVILGTITTYPGFFLNDDSMTDTTKYLQDGYFYQQFSYVIKVNQSLDKYRNIVKTLLHPAGLILFGEVTININLDVSTQFADGAACSFIDIHRQQFMYPNLFNELNVSEGQEYPLYHHLGLGYEEEDGVNVHIERSLNTLNTLGSTLGSFDYLKQQHLPYEGHTSFPEIDTSQPGDNANYWDQWGNYQYANIGHLIYEDFEKQPEKSINILPEPRFRTEE